MATQAAFAVHSWVDSWKFTLISRCPPGLECEVPVAVVRAGRDGGRAVRFWGRGLVAKRIGWRSCSKVKEMTWRLPGFS